MILFSVLGILAVLAYSGARIATDFEQRRNLIRDTRLTHLAQGIGELTHALQKERGASAGFLASNGTHFGGDLAGYREEAMEELRLLQVPLTRSGRTWKATGN